MAIQVLVPRQYTAKDLAKAAEAPVGARGKLKGSHIDDLVALGKLVLLCDFCDPKFNPRSNRYERYMKIPVAGLCDACGDHVWTGKAFIPQFNHDDVVYETPVQATRRRGRWAH